MKFRQLLIDLIKRTAAVATAAAILVGPAGRTLANPPNHDRERSEHPVHRLRHIIVIYQENWSFDSLYGQFPGANGLQTGFDTLPQYNKGTNYTSLIYKTPRPLNGGAADPNFPASPDGNLALWSDHDVALPLIPFDFTNYIEPNLTTGDLVHRFYTEQLQIDNGALEPKKTDLGKFVTWSDNPGLVLSYLDATNLPESVLAQQFTLCDNFSTRPTAVHFSITNGWLQRKLHRGPHRFLLAGNQATIQPQERCTTISSRSTASTR